MNKTNKNTKPVHLKIDGLILSEGYQKCKIFAQKLRKYHKKSFLEPSIKGYLEVDWREWLNRLQKNIGGQTWAMKKGVVVFVDEQLIGGEDDMFTHFYRYLYKSPRVGEVRNIARKDYLNYLNKNNLLYTTFKLSLGGEYMGTLLFELRPDLLPKTSCWFALLCDPGNHKGYSYKGTSIHRVCKSGWFQGGKMEDPRIMPLEDESYCYKHDRRGVVSFAKQEKHSSRTEFFVTFKPSTWMDQYYVAFGRVVEGFDVLRRLEYIKCIYEFPRQEIKIENCSLANVGLGRSLLRSIKLKMRGITLGEPHIDLDTFMNLVFDQFCETLFDRLDDEVKQKFHGEWIAETLWDKLLVQVKKRQPVEDYPDEKDRSSCIYLKTRYIAGLYDLKHIPDHFIGEMLNQIIMDAVERSDIHDMAKGIARVILESMSINSSRSFVGNSKSVADGLMNDLIRNVNKIIFGSETAQSGELQLGEKSDLKLNAKSIYRVLSEISTSSSPTDQHKKVRFTKSDFAVEEETPLSTKESVVGYILERLFPSLKTLNAEENQ